MLRFFSYHLGIHEYNIVLNIIAAKNLEIFFRKFSYMHIIDSV